MFGFGLFHERHLALSFPERARNSSLLFSIPCTLLAKNTGVYPFAQVPSAPSLVAVAPVYNRVSGTEAFS